MQTQHQVIEQRLQAIEEGHDHFLILMRQYIHRNKLILREYRLKKFEAMQKEEKKAPNK